MVAASFTAMLVVFGIAYSFAAFFLVFQQEFNASRADVSLVFAVSGFLYFIVGAVSGPLADRFQPRRVVFTGMIFLSAGLLAAYWAQSLWQVYATYSIGVGLGVGFVYVPAVAAVQRWFVRRRGFASGLAVAGIGVGTLLMPLLAVWLIPPFGWRGTYVAFAIIALTLGGGAAWFIEDSPTRRGLLPDNERPLPGTAPVTGVQGVTLRRALRVPAFWWLYFADAGCSLGLAIAFVHLAPYARDQGLSEASAATLLGLIGVGSIVGRFALGAFADRFGRRRSLIGIFAGMGIMLLWWWLSSSQWALIVFAVVFGIFYGGFVALVPALAMDYFGARNLSGILGLLYTSGAIGTLLGPTLSGMAYDNLHSYTAGILLGAAALAVSVVCSLALIEPEPGVARAN